MEALGTEFKYMKLLIDNYYSKGLFNIVKVNKPDTETNTREFVKKVRAMVTKMTLPQGSRDYNSLAVHTRSDLEGLHLFIDADLNAELDVDVLAKAFNLERSTFLANVTVIDGFAKSGLEAVLVDRDFFMVYDVEYLVKMKENEEGLYYNYWLHVWQILSTSRFANAVAFVSGEVPPVTQVIVDPVIASVRQAHIITIILINFIIVLFFIFPPLTLFYLTLVQYLYIIDAASALVAVPCGVNVLSSFPVITPVPTAHCIAVFACVDTFVPSLKLAPKFVVI